MRRVAAAVLHLQEVADGVVHVALDVGAHGVAVVRGKWPAGLGYDADMTGVVVRVRDRCAAVWPRCSRPVAWISR